MWYLAKYAMFDSFGMSHDGPHNGCLTPLGEKHHIMSPSLNSESSPVVWSNCSRTEITKFLEYQSFVRHSSISFK
jgi:thrombospondin motif-containing protein 7/thrombospondin motif-containing protein 12